MKTWNNAEIEVLSIEETANGNPRNYTEGSKRPWPQYGYHTNGTQATAEEIVEEVVDEGTTSERS